MVQSFVLGRKTGDKVKRNVTDVNIHTDRVYTHAQQNPACWSLWEIRLSSFSHELGFPREIFLNDITHSLPSEAECAGHVFSFPSRKSLPQCAA